MFQRFGFIRYILKIFQKARLHHEVAQLRHAVNFMWLPFSSSLQILHRVRLANPVLPGFLSGHLAGHRPGQQQFSGFALGYVAGDVELFFCHGVRAGGQLLTAALEAA